MIAVNNWTINRSQKLMFLCLTALFALSLVSMLNESFYFTFFSILVTLLVTYKFWGNPIFLGFVVAIPFGEKIFGYNVFPLIDIYLLVSLFKVKELFTEAETIKSETGKNILIYLAAFTGLLVITFVTGNATKTGAVSFVREISYMLFFLVGGLRLRTRENLTKFALALAAFSCLSGISVLVYMLLTNNFGLETRGAARIINVSWPNYYGIFLTLVTTLTCALLYSLKPKQKKFVLGLLFMLGIIILFSYSRAAYITTQISMILFVMVMEKSWWKKIGIALLIIVFFNFTPVAHQRMSATINQNAAMGVDNASYERVSRSISVLNFFKSNPKITIFGSGFRSTEYVVTTVYNENLKRYIPMGSAHNDYLDRVVRVGLIGLAVWAWFFVVFCWKLLRSSFSADYFNKVIIWGILTGLVGLAAAGLTEVIFKDPQTVTLIWLLVGSAGSLLIKDKQHLEV